MKYDWFRLYHGMIYDPKVRRLSLLAKWTWVTMLCLASQGHPRGSVVAMNEQDIQDAAGLDPTGNDGSIKDALEELETVKLIRSVKRGFSIPKFHSRQYDKPSDMPEATKGRQRRSRSVTPLSRGVTPRGEERREDKRSNILGLPLAEIPDNRPAPAFSGTFFDVSREQTAKWKTIYPGVDVLLEIGKADAWLEANPTQRKTNYHRFLVNWLSRAQDRSRPGSPHVGRGRVAAEPVLSESERERIRQSVAKFEAEDQ